MKLAPSLLALAVGALRGKKDQDEQAKADAELARQHNMQDLGMTESLARLLGEPGVTLGGPGAPPAPGAAAPTGPPPPGPTTPPSLPAPIPPPSLGNETQSGAGRAAALALPPHAPEALPGASTGAGAPPMDIAAPPAGGRTDLPGVIPERNYGPPTTLGRFKVGSQALELGYDPSNSPAARADRVARAAELLRLSEKQRHQAENHGAWVQLHAASPTGYPAYLEGVNYLEEYGKYVGEQARGQHQQQNTTLEGGLTSQRQREHDLRMIAAAAGKSGASKPLSDRDRVEWITKRADALMAQTKSPTAVNPGRMVPGLPMEAAYAQAESEWTRATTGHTPPGAGGAAPTPIDNSAALAGQGTSFGALPLLTPTQKQRAHEDPAFKSFLEQQGYGDEDF